MVGMGQSTSEGSSALLLGFPKPHSVYTPDSWVSMGLPLERSSHGCSRVISPALLVMGQGQGPILTQVGWQGSRCPPPAPDFCPQCQ